MMSEISDLRQKKLSLYHELKTVMLPELGYIDIITEDTLEEDENTTNKYIFSNSNIAYADASGRINPSGVSIYDVNRKLDISEFSVDYINSTVQLNSTPSGSITADYSYYTITVMDSFPEAEVFENTDLPMISIDFDAQDDDDYAIGQQKSFWTSTFYIDIFAINDGMRLDLTDRIQKIMKKWIPQLRFNEYPLNYNGTINTDFDWNTEFVRWIKMPRKTRATMINNGSLSDKERFRSVVRGSFITVN